MTCSFGNLKVNCSLLKLNRKLNLCHLSPGSSMVRASHRRSKGCGFDSYLGLRNMFLSWRLSLSSKQFALYLMMFSCFRTKALTILDSSSGMSTLISFSASTSQPVVTITRSRMKETRGLWKCLVVILPYSTGTPTSPNCSSVKPFWHLCRAQWILGRMATKRLLVKVTM